MKGHGDLWFSVCLNSTSAFLGSIASDGFHVDSHEWRLVSWDFTIPERKELKGRDRPMERPTVAHPVKGGPVWLDDVSLYVQGEQPEEHEASYYSGECVPLLTIPRTDEAIDVHGEIEDAGWSRAAGTTGFLLLGGALSPRQTEVLAVRDDANLYVAF